MSSRCEHPALTSPAHFHCGPCWRYISMSTLILHPFLNICLFQISNGLPHTDVYVDIFQSVDSLILLHMQSLVEISKKTNVQERREQKIELVMMVCVPCCNIGRRFISNGQEGNYGNFAKIYPHPSPRPQIRPSLVHPFLLQDKLLIQMHLDVACNTRGCSLGGLSSAACLQLQVDGP